MDNVLDEDSLSLHQVSIVVKTDALSLNPSQGVDRTEVSVGFYDHGISSWRNDRGDYEDENEVE